MLRQRNNYAFFSSHILGGIFKTTCSSGGLESVTIKENKSSAVEVASFPHGSGLLHSSEGASAHRPAVLELR